ncbi:MAG: isopenicillin N synthase family dioxygenase [Cyanophyceae cyanobacterium]
MTISPSIPVVRFEQWRDPTQRAMFVQTVGDALRDVGFFALEGHGIPSELIRNAYGTIQSFFELPDEIKRRYEDPAVKGQRGFVSFGREHAKNHAVPDLKEFWHVGREVSSGSQPSGWMPNVWPTEVARFRPLIEELYAQMETCALELLAAVSLYLDQPEGWLRQTAVGGNTILRLIHYPPIAEDTPVQSLRAAPHEDINLITLLCESTASGLQILGREGSWIPVEAPPGQIIVDAGDMLQHLTNGLLKSTTHRVVNPDDSRARRFSMPFFVHPRSEVDLTPLPHCIERTGGIPRFEPLTAGTFLMQRLQEIGLA